MALHFAAALIGLTAGVAVSLAAELGLKWLALALGLALFPLVVVVIGSLRVTMMALLIASLSIGLDVNLFYDDRYMELRRGIQITAFSAITFAAIAQLRWMTFTRRIRFRYYPSVLVPMLLILILSGLSAIRALYPMYILRYYPMVITCALIFLYGANFLRKREDTRIIVTWTALTVAISSALGLLEFFSNGAINLSFLGGAETVVIKQYSRNVALTRVSGSLVHPNTLAFYLCGFLPILMAYAVAVRDLRLKLLCLGSCALGFVTLILTFTRGGWIAFLLSGMVIGSYFFTPRARHAFPRAWLRLGGVGCLGAVLVVPFIPSIIVRLTEPDRGAAAVRIPLALTALKVIEANPIVGVGLGNYKETVSRYDFTPSISGGQPNRVHNMYLLTAAEIGIPALLTFFWMCGVFTYRACWCILLGNGEVGLFAIGMLAGMIAMLSHGMVEPGNFSMVKYVWIMFQGGLLLALDTLRRTEASREPPAEPAG